MARIAGLRLRERWGDWSGEPFTASSWRHISIYEPPTKRSAAHGGKIIQPATSVPSWPHCSSSLAGSTCFSSVKRTVSCSLPAWCHTATPPSRSAADCRRRSPRYGVRCAAVSFKREKLAGLVLRRPFRTGVWGVRPAVGLPARLASGLPVRLFGVLAGGIGVPEVAICLTT